MNPLLTKEMLILSYLSKCFPKLKTSQRVIARETKISLGLVNVIIKRLVALGFISEQRIDDRSVHYILTSSGLQETAKSSYNQITATIEKYDQLKQSVSSLLFELYRSGYNYFSIHGDGEMKNLVESVFRKCLEEAPVVLGEEHKNEPCAVALNLKPEPLGADFKGNAVNVLEKIHFPMHGL